MEKLFSYTQTSKEGCDEISAKLRRRHCIKFETTAEYKA